MAVVGPNEDGSCGTTYDGSCGIISDGSCGTTNGWQMRDYM
jgi:hypothetical protein